MQKLKQMHSLHHLAQTTRSSCRLRVVFALFVSVADVAVFLGSICSVKARAFLFSAAVLPALAAVASALVVEHKTTVWLARTETVVYLATGSRHIRRQQRTNW